MAYWLIWEPWGFVWHYKLHKTPRGGIILVSFAQWRQDDVGFARKQQHACKRLDVGLLLFKIQFRCRARCKRCSDDKVQPQSCSCLFGVGQLSNRMIPCASVALLQRVLSSRPLSKKWVCRSQLWQSRHFTLFRTSGYPVGFVFARPLSDRRSLPRERPSPKRLHRFSDCSKFLLSNVYRPTDAFLLSLNPSWFWQIKFLHCSNRLQTCVAAQQIN